ncbi:hypothetical protein B0H13DRAFT_2349338 [Mycena leptocephala]|nr:hypothetical protein B0H13DRAFT_2349338 [Mycena leptocephala]
MYASISEDPGRESLAQLRRLALLRMPTTSVNEICVANDRLDTAPSPSLAGRCPWSPLLFRDIRLQRTHSGRGLVRPGHMTTLPSNALTPTLRSCTLVPALCACPLCTPHGEPPLQLALECARLCTAHTRRRASACATSCLRRTATHTRHTTRPHRPLSALALDAQQPHTLTAAVLRSVLALDDATTSAHGYTSTGTSSASSADFSACKQAHGLQHVAW